MTNAVPSEHGEYLIYEAGKLVGAETFSIESLPSGVLATGFVRLESPNTLSQNVELSLDQDFRPQTLIVSGASRGVTFKMSATFRGDTAHVVREGPEGQHSEEIRVEPDSVVIVHNVWHHLLLLVRRYDVSGVRHKSFALFPSGSIIVEERERYCAQLVGRQEVLRHLFVDIGGVFGIRVFILGNHLVKIHAPLQKFEAILQGIPGLDQKTELFPIRTEAEKVEISSLEVREEEVRFSATDGVVLAGTIALPVKPGLLPAVLLIVGSGPQDRNSDSGPGGLKIGILRTLAKHLSQAGIVVLRYDKRGVGNSQGTYDFVCLNDLVGDAGAAIRFLRSRPEVDVARIGIIGHSEGGLIATMLASGDVSIRAILLLGAPGHRFAEILLRQFERVSNRMLQKDKLAASLERRRRTLESLQRTGDWDSSEVEEQVRRAVAPARRKWFQDLLTLDPTSVLSKVHTSVAIFQGGRDIQVDPDDALLLGNTLDEAGHRDHLVRIFPDLDHLFMRSEGQGLSEYADPDRNLDPEFLEAVIEWIQNKLG